jgi:enoyl-CoA hydratase/carnithine racemase
VRDLRLEVDGGVATLVIDRPQARNALGRQTMRELDDVLGSIHESGARVLVIRGAGARAFCAGGDLKELEHIRSESEAADMATAMRGTLDRIPKLPMPVIAAINGDALGGGAELAVACDFRVAADHARIGFAQISLGLMPAWGASERLAALVGRGRALYMLFSGAIISAGESKALGLVEEVYTGESFDERVGELARKIAAAPPDALAGIKATVNAVRPHHNPELASETIAAFAKTWADPAHWDAVANLERRRRDR